MLISVHLPKTAGTSFRHSLADHYGEKMLLRYGERPLGLPEFERHKLVTEAAINLSGIDYQNIECIHGHFLPFQYLLLQSNKNLTFVTWMRNPVDRLISNYYHIKNYHKQYSSSFQYRVIEENWPLEQYCLSEEMRNIYAQFLWAFPLENFEFIGITEYYEKDFIFFREHYLTKEIPVRKLNVNPDKKANYRISKPLRKKIEAYNAEDMALYERALKKRGERGSQFHFTKKFFFRKSD
jgi:hypothetical protein